MVSTQHYEHSSLRENIIEHLIIGELLRLLWRNGITDVEILRSEFDGYGYDLVISRGSLVRHLQLKSGKKLTKVTVGLSLAERTSGCVLFIAINDALDLGPFYWFGSAAGQKLSEIQGLPPARRPTHNKDGVRPERQKHRDIKRMHFVELPSLFEVAKVLLGTDLNDH